MTTPPPPPPPGGPPPPPPPFGDGPPSQYGVVYGAGYPPAGGTRANGMAIASLVLGIIGLVACCLFVPSLLAIVFGAVAINQCKNDPTYTGRGMAIAGLILGVVAVVLGIGFLVLGEAWSEMDLQ